MKKQGDEGWGRRPGLTRIPSGGLVVLLDVLKFRRNIMEMKSRDSTMTTTRTGARARARARMEDGEFNCVITCALAYAIGSSRPSERATS